MFRAVTIVHTQCLRVAAASADSVASVASAVSSSSSSSSSAAAAAFTISAASTVSNASVASTAAAAASTHSCKYDIEINTGHAPPVIQRPFYSVSARFNFRCLRGYIYPRQLLCRLVRVTGGDSDET